MAEEFKISLGLELRNGELDGIRNQINGLRVNPIDLQINTRNVQNQIDNIRRQIESLGNIRINLGGNGGGGNGGGNHIRRQAEDVVRAYRELTSLQNRLSSKMSALDKLDTLDTSRSQQEIVELTTQINNLYTRYQNLYNLFSQRLSPIQTDNLTRGFEVLGERLNIINSQLRDTNANIVNTINTSFSNGTFANDLSQIDASLAKIRTQSSGVITGMQQLNDALANMQIARANGDIVTLISNYERYKNALRNVQNQIEINLRAEKMQNEDAKLTNATRMFSAKMDIWLSKNSAATKQFGAEIDALKARLESCDNVQFDQLKAEFADLQRRAEIAGKTHLTFGDRFAEQMGRLSSYFSAATLITYGTRAVKEMYNNVVEVDTAMTELYRVTDLTATQYDTLYDNMVSSAKEYGSTLTDIISSTADWVRLGFDANTANQLAEITAMYQHISDLDNETAVENLVTAYKGYQDQLLSMYNGDAAAAIEYIADIFNELDNNFAVTADNIGTALTKSASALEIAGNTIQESAAMVTGITEVTQDPEKAGSSLKVLSLRLRGMKGELEELGEEIDDNVDSISKMQTQVLNFTGGKVNIFNDDGSFKSTYEIMQGIAEIYDDLTDTNKADLLETIAGKNRANDVAALISNWNQVESAMKSAMGAEGSAAAENEKHMESIKGRLDALTASWQAFSNTFVNSDFVKVLISGLTGVLDILDAIVNTLGSFGTIGIGVGLFNIVKHAKEFANLRIVSALPSELKNVSTYAQAAAYDLKAFIKTPAGIASAVGLAVTAINTIVQAYKNWEAEQARLRQATLDTNNEILSSIDSFEQAYVKYSNKTSLTTEEENELTIAINGTITALGGKAGAIQGVIDKNNDYIDSLESVAQAELEEARRRAKESLDAAKDSLQSASWDSLTGSEITVSLGTSKSDDAVKNARSVAESIMSDYIDKESKKYGKGRSVIEYELEPLDWDVDHSNMDAVVDYYYKLIELKDTLLQKSIDENDDSYINNSVYDNTKSSIDALSNSVEEYLTQQYNLAKYDYEIQNGIPKTVEEYYAMRDAILSNINASQDYKDAIGGIADVEWGSIFDLSKKSSNQVAEILEEQKKKVIDSFKDDSITEWFNSLSPDEKELVYKIGVQADDTTLWTLTQWKQELVDMSETGKTSSESLQSFYDVLNNAKDGNFSETINSYVEDIDTLKEALININELTEEDILELAMNFPELIGKTGDIQTLSTAISELITKTQTGLDDKFAEQLEALGGSSTTAGQALLALQSMFNSVTAVGFTFDIDKEIEKFNNIYDAMKESVSGTGLSTDGIKNVESMFSGLDGYDPSVLFERTEHGIHLNTTALRALQSQYESMNRLNIQKRLQDLKQKYNDTEGELGKLTAGTDEYNKKASELKGIENQIHDVQTLAAQYEGLTSAYNKWILAQSSGEEGDMYDNISGSLEDIKKLYDEGLVGTNAFRTAVQMMTNEDLSTASIDTLISKYQEGYPAMKRYFTEGQEGCIRFLEDIQSLNSEWASMNSDGTWEINFGVGNDDAIAKAISDMTGLEISTEQVQIILRKLSDYGFDINLDSAYTSIEDLQSRIEETEGKLLETFGEDWSVCCNIYCEDSELETEINKAKSELKYLSGLKSTPEVEARTDDANARLDYLVKRLIELNNQENQITIDASQVDSELQDTLIKLQEYQLAVDNLKALELKGADATEIDDAKQKVQDLSNELKNVPQQVSTILNLEEGADVGSIIEKISNGEASINVSADVTKATNEIDSINDKNVEVNVTVNGEDAIATLKETIESIKDKKVKISVTTIGLTLVQPLADSISMITDKTVFVDVIATGAESVNTLSENIKLLSSASITVTATAIGKSDVDSLKLSFDALYDKTVDAKANVSGESNVNSLKKSIKGLSNKTVNVRANVYGKTEAEELKKAIDDLKSKAITITTVYLDKGNPAGMDGTANVSGTAYARGNWGTKESGVALGGELGQELVVRDGRWFTIGDNSAEFFAYKKGDIIFNAEQTKQIFKEGRIIRGSGRGRALAEGTAFSGGSGQFMSGGTVVLSSSGIKDKTTAKDTTNNKTEDFKETFDWIETAIDRIERAINSLDLKANSIYKSWSNRNKSLSNEIIAIKDEIELQEAAYDRYIKEANNVGLSSQMAELVRQGAIDIDTVENEELAEKIGQYKEWYEKALDCKDAIDELGESLAECYKTSFDNIVTQYDGIIAIIGHEKSMLDEYIAQSEANGYVTSSKYYEALIENERKNITNLGNEKSKLLTELQNGLSSGIIQEGSEAWNEMINQIDEVTLAIEQGNTAIIEYSNSIREIDWQIFDLLQSQISQVTKEADFLINLFSNDKLYQDSGKLTNEGMTTMGLHGQNYNVYMAQADAYAQEMLDIDRQLATDPYNQQLLERRQELLELQQENILAAEDEKQAIVNMVSEGIELELDALQDLIDTYTNALDAKKDLYNYQKKVVQQTKKIADLEKQMSAYAGDDSEESKKKIQQIKVSLEEAKNNLQDTEYDKYISDQKKLVDDLYIEYETILNQRLDNVDALLSDMILEINTNSNMINDTIVEKVGSVGITLSESMSSIWGENTTGTNSVLTTYGQNIQNGISSATTTVNTTLNAMNTNLQQMISHLSTIANTKVDTANNSSASSNNSTLNQLSASYTSPTTNSSSGGSNNKKSLTDKDYYGVALAIWNGNYGWGTGSTRKSNLKAKGFDVDKMQSIINKMDKDGYIRSGSWVGKYYGITSLSPYHYNKYASGKQNINHNQWALTQEKGLEMIVRPSDGAILTPIAKTDSILNTNASNNIWDMANNPSEFIKNNLKLDNISTPVSQNVQNNYTQNLDRVVFNLPSVKNYEELLSAMRNDKNFERLIMAMTIDRIAGKTSLAKGKSIR